MDPFASGQSTIRQTVIQTPTQESQASLLDALKQGMTPVAAEEPVRPFDFEAGGKVPLFAHIECTHVDVAWMIHNFSSLSQSLTF